MLKLCAKLIMKLFLLYGEFFFFLSLTTKYKGAVSSEQAIKMTVTEKTLKFRETVA